MFGYLFLFALVWFFLWFWFGKSAPVYTDHLTDVDVVLDNCDRFAIWHGKNGPKMRRHEIAQIMHMEAFSSDREETEKAN
jgi:hypothetical protein